MKKTKIICTMGPNTNDRNLMKKLVENGMDIARFNFSHGDHAEQKERMDMLKSIREEVGKPVAILLDTKGPEIRTGLLKDGKKVMLEAGQTFTLTTEVIEGDANRVSITYDGLAEDVEIGKHILIDDGLIELEVKKIADTEIVCKVLNGGELGQRKGVNVPNVPVRLPALTEKDRGDIVFGIQQGVDFIAASFVRSAEGILEIKALLKEHKAPYIPIIAKIENAEGIKNIDEILHCADGIMVARGDLGVEIPAQEVPHLQKLEKELRNDDVVFVSISSDKDEQAWRSKMEELKMHGNQLLDKDNTLCDALNVKGIPFFVIYDKAGNLHTYGALRPSTGTHLRSVLEGLK